MEVRAWAGRTDALPVSLWIPWEFLLMAVVIRKRKGEGERKCRLASDQLESAPEDLSAESLDGYRYGHDDNCCRTS